MSKVLIIGGVAGGATAAGRLRRISPEAEIIMFERGKYISFANCGLPYYIGGEVKDPEELLLVTPEGFHKTYDIDVRTEHEVVSIHPNTQHVVVKNLQTGETYYESYEKLLISTGSTPLEIPLPGKDLEGVLHLQSYQDMLHIKEYMDGTKAKTAVVVGGGFIGLEMVENFCGAGLEVHLVQRGEQIFGIFDEDMALSLPEVLEKKGVHLHLDTDVSGIIMRDGKKYVTTKAGEEIQGDIVLLSIGVRPASDLAEEAGLELGIRKSIVTNNRMQTSDPNIYAVGDVVQVNHVVSGEATLISLAGPAHMQARVAAENIAGQVSRYKGSFGSSILKLFHLTLASTGLNSQQAEKAGYEFDSALINSVSHAGYFPGAEEFTMKILYEEFTGRILGGQVIGGKGVDKRCDVIATAIAGKLTAWDLEELQLCYAPPFNIPRDAVNILGGIIVGNIESTLANRQCTQAHKEIQTDDNHILLDIRSPEKFQQGHAENALHIPYTQLMEDVGVLDKKKTYYVLCNTGHQSGVATKFLMGEGYDAYNVCGGWKIYRHLVK